MKMYKSAIAFIVVLILFVSSCTTYKSINHATNMVELARNPFMKNLAKSIIKDVDEINQNRSSNFSGKIKLTTTLNSVMPIDLMKEFTNLLSKKYNIAQDLIDRSYNTWNTIRDVVGFVAKNGNGFHFYKQ